MPSCSKTLIPATITAPAPLREPDFPSPSPPQLALTSTLKISPSSQATRTSKGRQQISQSTINCCDASDVSTDSSKFCPQNGHWICAVSSIEYKPSPTGLCPRVSFESAALSMCGTTNAGFTMGYYEWIEHPCI